MVSETKTKDQKARFVRGRGKQKENKKPARSRSASAASRKSSAGSKVLRTRSNSHKNLMPRLQVNKLSGNSASLAKAIALPLNYSARLPDPFARLVTTTANPFSVTNVDFSTYTTAVVPFAQGGYLAAISRDPLNGLIRTTFNATSAYYTYGSQFFSLLAGFNTTGTLMPTTIFEPVPTGVMMTVPFTFAFWEYQTGPAMYGSKQYGKRADLGHGPTELRYMWIDAHTSATANVTFKWYSDPFMATPLPLSAPSALQGVIRVWVYDGETALPSITTNVTSAATAWLTTIYLQASAYYAFEFVGTPTNSFQTYCHVQMQNSSAVCLAHEPIEGIDTRAGDIEGVRVVGKSLMFSPASAELAKGGTVAGIQLPSQELVTSLLPAVSTDSITSGLTTRSGLGGNATLLSFDKGMYCYHLPTSEEDMCFQKPFCYSPVVGSSGISRPTLSDFACFVKPRGGWAVLAVSTPPSILGGNNYPGALMRLTVGNALEFETSSLWYSLSSPPQNKLAVDELMMLLRGVQQFTENPFHFRDISNWISRNANTLKKVSNIASHALGVLFPEGRVAFSAIDGALQRL